MLAVDSGAPSLRAEKKKILADDAAMSTATNLERDFLNFSLRSA